MSFSPTPVIFKPSQQRGPNIAVYLFPGEPELCYEFSFKRRSASGEFSTYICVSCRSLKDFDRTRYGPIPTVRVMDRKFVTDPMNPSHQHYCEPRSAPRALMRREVINACNRVRLVDDERKTKDIEAELLEAIDKPEFGAFYSIDFHLWLIIVAKFAPQNILAHYGTAEKLTMVQEVIIGYGKGRDALRKNIQRNRNKRRSRVSSGVSRCTGKIKELTEQKRTQKLVDPTSFEDKQLRSFVKSV
uniref:Uncharacterized protein n=1 Tax=Heterorhabditis bacteriophora TaxID=37862 RepID=A0A1I7XUE1_HETBA